MMKKIMMMVTMVALSVEMFGAGSITFSKEALTKESVHKILSEKYNATRDDDGDTVIVNAGRKVLVIQDKKRDVVVFRWSAKASGYARADKLELCQRYNADKVFVRFYLDKDDDYAADYFLPYDGGLNSENLKISAGWFFSVLDDFVKSAQALKEGK